jgi:hypothetical protein
MTVCGLFDVSVSMLHEQDGTPQSLELTDERDLQRTLIVRQHEYRRLMDHPDLTYQALEGRVGIGGL